MTTRVDVTPIRTYKAPAGLVSTLIVRRIDAWGAAAISAGMALIVHDAVASRTTGLLASIALLYWLGYFLNDYFDAPFDVRDEEKAKSNFFVIHAVAPRLLVLVVAAVSLSLLVACAQFGPRGLRYSRLGMWPCGATLRRRCASRAGRVSIWSHTAFSC